MLVVVVSDDDETLLLCRRTPAGFWQSVTGSLKKDESPADAARRELAEETGLRGGGRLTDTGRTVKFEIAPAWRHRYAPGVTHNLEHQFLFRIRRSSPVSLAPAEHRGYAWTSLREAMRRVGSWTNRDALQAI